jgi:hypothetical protein
VWQAAGRSGIHPVAEEVNLSKTVPQLYLVLEPEALGRVAGQSKARDGRYYYSLELAKT